MIRFVDSKALEDDYQKSCKFDKVFGTINLFLFKKHANYSSGFFWNLYNDDGELLGNLSFTNDTFTICVKDDSCSEEIVKFIDFWGNFALISYNKCNAKSLDIFMSIPNTPAFGAILYANLTSITPSKTANICKDISLYDAFCLFKESFPEKLAELKFSDFNYGMNFRLRKQLSSLYGIVKDETLASALEVMCYSEDNVVLGCLATDKNHRGKGFASSLLCSLFDDFPNSSVYVFAENDSVENFYKKLGFKDYAVWAQITPARKD